MLIAYLRGLLLPDYPNGIRSIIRENYILQALNREIGASELVDRIKMESSFVPAIESGSKINNLLKQLDKMLSLAYENLSHAPQLNKGKYSKYNVNELERFIATYEMLEKQGLVGDIKNNGV